MLSGSSAACGVEWHLATARRRTAWLTLVAIAGSVVLAYLTMLLQLGSIVVLLTCVGLLAIAWRPRVGLYVVFGLTCLFEAGGLDPLMQLGGYLHGDVSTSMNVPGVIFSPLELLLLLSMAVWLARGLVSHRVAFGGGRLSRPVLLFFASLVFGLVRGQMGGGLLTYALWESRFLFYLVICYVLATSTVTSRRAVRTLMALFVIGSLLLAVEGAYRRVALIDTGQLGTVPEFWYAHEDVVFLGSLILLGIAQYVFGASRWQRWLGPLMIGVGTYTLLVTERRAGQIAAMVGFLGFALVFLFARRRAFFRIVVPVLVLAAIYFPLFWSASGPLAEPARAVRSLRDPDPRDAASNESRELEKLNIIATIRANPLGVGFGRPYLIVAPMPDISWFTFWQYETHRNVLWVWMKTGAVGFVMFLVLLGGSLAHAARLVRTLHAPELKTFAMLGIACVLTTMAFTYVDLGWTMGRIPVLIGTVLGTLDVLERLDEPAGAPA